MSTMSALVAFGRTVDEEADFFTDPALQHGKLTIKHMFPGNSAVVASK